MELLFSPTIALMSRLKYPAKFGVMGLLRRADSQLLGKLQILRRHIADDHALSHDPDTGEHYMLDTAIVESPEALEKLGQIRGLGTGILANGSLSQGQRLQMHALQ